MGRKSVTQECTQWHILAYLHSSAGVLIQVWGPSLGSLWGLRTFFGNFRLRSLLTQFHSPPWHCTCFQSVHIWLTFTVTPHFNAFQQSRFQSIFDFFSEKPSNNCSLKPPHECGKDIVHIFCCFCDIRASSVMPTPPRAALLNAAPKQGPDAPVTHRWCCRPEFPPWSVSCVFMFFVMLFLMSCVFITVH